MKTILIEYLIAKLSVQNDCNIIFRFLSIYIYLSKSVLFYHVNQGKVSFDVNGDSLFELSIYQIRHGEAIPIADYSPFTDEITWLVDEASLFVGKVSV